MSSNIFSYVMQRILLLLFLSIFFFSQCGPVKQVVVNSDQIEFTTTYTAIEKMMNTNQLDSLFVVDSLPNLNEWYFTSLNDAETNNEIKEYFFVCSSQDSTITYTVQPYDKHNLMVTKKISK